MVRNLFLPLAFALLLLPGQLAAQPPQPQPATQLVELDGRQVRIQTGGLANRRPGAPIVVFEAGAMSSLDAWQAVIANIANDVSFVAYDRAGLGQSEWDLIKPTPQHATARLHRLLQLVGAPPPYVLVGHSWGGTLAHYYAGYHPDDVAGLVFVDPAPVLTQEPSGNLAPFEAIGSGRAGYDAYWSSFSTLLSKASPAVRAEFDVYRGLLDSPLSSRDLRPLPNVPIVVLVAGKYLHLPFFKDYPFDAKAHFEADLRHRSKLLQEWALASDNGLLLISRSTNHAIPREDPKLVVWSIRRVLDILSGQKP